MLLVHLLVVTFEVGGRITGAVELVASIRTFPDIVANDIPVEAGSVQAPMFALYLGHFDLADLGHLVNGGLDSEVIKMSSLEADNLDRRWPET